MKVCFVSPAILNDGPNVVSGDSDLPRSEIFEYQLPYDKSNNSINALMSIEK